MWLEVTILNLQPSCLEFARLNEEALIENECSQSEDMKSCGWVHSAYRGPLRVEVLPTDAWTRWQAFSRILPGRKIRPGDDCSAPSKWYHGEVRCTGTPCCSKADSSAKHPTRQYELLCELTFLDIANDLTLAFSLLWLKMRESSLVGLSASPGGYVRGDNGVHSPGNVLARMTSTWNEVSIKMRGIIYD